MSAVGLQDLLNEVLLSYYLEEVSGRACQVLDVNRSPAFSIGETSRLPKLDEATCRTLSDSPLPIEIGPARACALVGGGEVVGYMVVEAKGEEDSASEFAFQLANELIALKSSNNDKAFDVGYLKSVIAVVQRMVQKTATVFDPTRVAEIFLKESRTLFPVKSAAVIAIENKNLKLLTSIGEPFNDNETVGYVCFSGKPLVCNDVATDPRFVRLDDEGRKKPLSFKNVLAVPLLSGDVTLGAIYFCDKETGPFWEDDQKMAQTLGAFLGSTIANIQLHNSMVETERVRSNLERYLSPNLVKEVIETGAFPELGGSRKTATILFSDIRGFTRLSERFSPEQMVAQLNEYFEEMSKIIFAYDGTLDKYVGDMIMVLFGVPKPLPDANRRAVRVAQAMQERLAALNERWRNEKRAEFSVGIGINSGEVVFGNIGSSHAMGLTVIGDHVNRAQRLEAYAKGGQILISESVNASLDPAEFKTKDLGMVESKNKTLQAFLVE